MLLSLVLALSSLLCLQSLATEEGSTPSFKITPLTSTVIGLKDDFVFTCLIDNSNYTVSLLIDNITNSSKLDRIRSQVIVHGFVYTLNETTPTDNGTVFSCIATGEGAELRTSNVTISVEYAPIFSYGNNASFYHYINTGQLSQLNCTIANTNPPLTVYRVVNDSSNTTNVIFDRSTGAVVFRHPVPNNRGVYSCIATNKIGTTHIKYTAFIGGPPDMLSVEVTTLITNHTLLVGVGVDDTSHAPAQQLYMSLVGLTETIVNFTSEGLSLPVRHAYIQVLDVPLSDLYSGNYTVRARGSNVLGNQTRYIEQKVFVNGTLPITPSLISDMSNITTGTDYLFTCTVYPSVPVNFTFTVTVDDRSKLPRLVIGPFNGYSQNFTLKNVTYIDDQTTFACVANELYHSNELTMRVVFPPAFISDSNDTYIKYIKAGEKSGIHCYLTVSNPPIQRMWVHLDVPDDKNVEASVDPDNLSADITITDATLQNSGLYTCLASNAVGTTSVTWRTFVGDGGPDNVTIKAYPSSFNNSLVVAMTFTDHSNAPATIFKVSLSNKTDQYIHIEEPRVPANELYLEVYNTPLDQLMNGKYTLNVSGTNDLGTTDMLYSTQFYVNGTRPLSVQLVSAVEKVTEGDEFEFSCTVDTSETSIPLEFDVMVEGDSNGEKYSRIIRGSGSIHSQQFIFVNTTWEDDLAQFVCVVNEVYKSTQKQLTVYYPPHIVIPDKVGNFTGRSLSFSVSIIRSNPPQYITKWFKGSNELLPSDNIIIEGDSVHFKNLSLEDTSPSSVVVDNGVFEGTVGEFNLYSFDGPWYKEGCSNCSAFTERQVGTDAVLTCTITHADPPVTNLFIQPETGPNWNMTRNGNESVSLVFQNATTVNKGEFTCVAVNNLTTATLTYSSYFGGPPDGVNVNITRADSNTAVILNFNITDISDAPATGLYYNIQGYDGVNGTRSFTPLLNGTFIVYDRVFEKNYSYLGGSGMTNHLFIYALNDLGQALVMDYNFTNPGELPSSFKAKDIAIYGSGPLIVVVFIVIMIVITVVYQISKRRRRRNNYSRIPDGDTGSVNGSS